MTVQPSSGITPPTGFTPRAIGQPSGTEDKRRANKKLLEKIQTDFVKEQLADLSGTRIARYWIAGAVGSLLLVQHLFIYGMVIWAFATGQLNELQVFLGTIIAATLYETYKVVQIIVQWVFKDRPHKPDCDL